MKKTIGTLALFMSVGSAHALIGPIGGGPEQPKPKKACLNIIEDQDGVQYAGSCDERANNKQFHRKLLANGCAEGQAAFASIEVKLSSCRNPNIVQL